MLEHLKGLSRFRDIALGHQKSISSRSATVWMPPRIIWGRNYTTAKEFDTVMDELRAGSGSRYSGCAGGTAG